MAFWRQAGQRLALEPSRSSMARTSSTLRAAETPELASRPFMVLEERRAKVETASRVREVERRMLIFFCELYGIKGEGFGVSVRKRMTTRMGGVEKGRKEEKKKIKERAGDEGDSSLYTRGTKKIEQQPRHHALHQNIYEQVEQHDSIYEWLAVDPRGRAFHLIVEREECMMGWSEGGGARLEEEDGWLGMVSVCIFCTLTAVMRYNVCPTENHPCCPLSAVDWRNDEGRGERSNILFTQTAKTEYSEVGVVL